MNIAICDDEQKICEIYFDKVRMITKNIGILIDIIVFNEPDKLLKSLSEEHYDIVLLDIDMPYINGLQVAEEMEKKNYETILIFITNQDALVYQSFQYHPFGFIRKSHIDDELEHVLVHAIEKINVKRKRFCFRQDLELVSLVISDILYFEADGNYLMVHTREQIYRCRTTITKTEAELQHNGFIRIHKGFLINQEAVYRIGNDEIMLINHNTLPIGRKNKNEIKQKIMRCLMK